MKKTNEKTLDKVENADIILPASQPAKRKSLNNNLKKAKAEKNDEFYTQLTDIDKELKHYTEHFKDKVVLCNCDDPRISNFFHYFSYNFEKLGLKKLISVCYKNNNRDLFSNNQAEQAIWLEYTGERDGGRIPTPEEIGIHHLRGDGDFRSEECIELLKQADIVVTNPPFSLFREYVAQLVEHNKKFLILGNVNSLSYKDIFKRIKENQMWVGYNCVRHFQIPDGSLYEAARTYWYTNLDIKKRHEDVILFRTYYGNESDYPTYDNYDAIEVSKAANIPEDYKGLMGVPITFLDKFNPDQFEILGMASSAGYDEEVVGIPFRGDKDARPLINSKNTFARVIIRNKKL